MFLGQKKSDVVRMGLKICDAIMMGLRARGWGKTGADVTE